MKRIIELRNKYDLYMKVERYSLEENAEKDEKYIKQLLKTLLECVPKSIKDDIFPKASKSVIKIYIKNNKLYYIIKKS